MDRIDRFDLALGVKVRVIALSVFRVLKVLMGCNLLKKIFDGM